MSPLLTLEGSLGGGTSASTRPLQAGAERSIAGADGGTVTASASLLYSMSRERYGVSVFNVVIGDYYSGLSGGKVLPRYVAGASASFMPFRPTRVSIAADYRSLPQFSASDLFEGELGQVVPLRQDLSLSVERYGRYGASVGVSQNLSRRTRANLGVSYGRGRIESRVWTNLLYSGSLSYSISRGLGVYVGYQDGGQRTDSGETSSGRDRLQRINFGVDYNRPLSLSRRTTLSFSTGTAGIQDPVLDETSYFLIGSASLNHEFGQTWLTSLSYGRNVRYLESFGEPLFSDAVNLGLQGSFSRRLQFQAGVGRSAGRLVTSGGADTDLDTSFGTAQLSLALSRLLSLATDYAYYRYSVPPALSLDSFGRDRYQSIRVRLQVWVPLITRRQP